MHPCPLPCKVHSWVPVGECSAQCGGGIQTYTREVVPVGTRPPESCPEARTKYSTCNTEPCVVSCEVAEWSAEGSCSASCGDGYQKYTREVTQYPRGRNSSCPALVKEEPCIHQECDQDCEVGDWLEEVSCPSDSCRGIRKLKREVIFNAKGYGKPCPVLTKTEKCDSCPVNCDDGEWREAGSCSAQCGAGQMDMTFEVDKKQIKRGQASPCPTRTKKVVCNPNPCPVDCELGPWGMITPCSQDGTQQMSRMVVTPDAHGGAPCGDLLTIMSCTSSGANDCEYGPWRETTRCSKECDGGIRHLERELVGLSAQSETARRTCSDTLMVEPCNVDPCERSAVVGPWQKDGYCVGEGMDTKQGWRRDVVVSQIGNGTGNRPSLYKFEPCMDCEVSGWKPQGECSKSCGGGVQMMQRYIMREPVRNGKPCGELHKEVVCNQEECPSDCVVGPWTPKTPCSNPCGGGLQEFERKILTHPGGNGKKCPDLSSRKLCNEMPCSLVGSSTGSNLEMPANVDCEMSPWTKDGHCPCGGGLQRFKRHVLTHQLGMGSSCGESMKEETCSNTTCSEQDCEVGPWLPYGDCTVPCGGGHQKFVRGVTTPPVGKERKCPELSKMEPCNAQICVNIECKLSSWTASGTCTDGKQSFLREVIEAPRGDVLPCPELVKTQPCSGTGAIKAIDCVVSDWSPSGDCSLMCGGGEQTFTRQVLEAPNDHGKQCPKLEDTRKCNAHECNEGCVVGEWKTVGECDEPCGGGVLTYSREVSVKPGSSLDRDDCPEDAKYEECNVQVCDTDCVVGEWKMEGDGECSAPCGGGVLRHYRDVLVPAEGLGLACPSLHMDKECNEQSCDGCQYTDWTSTSGCSAECGGGTQSYSREIVSGESCGEELTKTEICNEIDCNAPCILGEWELEGFCTHPCGGGYKRKVREVLQEPGPEGNPCGELFENLGQCNPQACPSKENLAYCEYHTFCNEDDPDETSSHKCVANSWTKLKELFGEEICNEVNFMEAEIDKFGIDNFNAGVRNATSKSLILSKNGIDDDMAIKLAMEVQGLEHLEWLDLEFNSITDKGAYALALAFQDNEHFKMRNLHISLKGNAITEKGKKYLAGVAAKLLDEGRQLFLHFSGTD